MRERTAALPRPISEWAMERLKCLASPQSASLVFVVLSGLDCADSEIEQNEAGNYGLINARSNYGSGKKSKM